ncbi:MAG: PAS domain-containing protein [Candidatus Odinarchaeota archaeon]
MTITYKDICKNIFSETDFIENSLIGIGVLQDGRIIYANNTILKHFGYSFDEIQEKGFWMKVIHPEDLSIVKRKIEFKLKEKKYNTSRYKCRILLKSGVSKWIEVFSKNFYHNGRLAILFTIIEVPEPAPIIELSTINLAKLNVMEELLQRFKVPYRILKTGDFQKDLEEKLLQEKIALKDAEHMFHHLFETSPSSIILLNFKGDIIDCNRTSEKLFNYTKDELIGKNFIEFLNFPAKDRFILENAYDHLTKGEKVPPIEIHCFTKNGRAIWIKMTITLVKLHNEIIIQMIIQDITLTESK